MGDSFETIPVPDLGQSESTKDKAPGLLMVFSNGRPTHLPIAIEGDAVEVGRDSPRGLDDPSVSRRHVRVAPEEGGWRVEDLASRNGSAVDGRPFTGEVRGPFRVLRAGTTLFLLVDDIRPHQEFPVEVTGDTVAGARLGGLWKRIRASAASPALHITGESGSGKELAARTYHQAGPRPSGPFVAVNCAAIPEGIAERLLFGAVKGAFSGAVKDAPGHLQAANGGTLFLDEIGELTLAVQAKLLRVLETHEVVALGASKSTRVDLHLCSATHRDLRARVTDGAFREDLYYRVARPHVSIPPLRERLDEIPHLVALAVRRVAPALAPHVTLVEACLVRPWPGNVRELMVEIGDATRQAALQDQAKDGVTGRELAAHAGLGFVRPTGPTPEPDAQKGDTAALPSRAAIEDALRQHGGQVATAARALGLRRNQLRRWLARHNVDPRSFGAGTGEG